MRRLPLLLALTACAGDPPPNPDVLASAPAALAACPERPNCVSSAAADAGHRIPALPLKGTRDEALARIRAAVLSLPRARIAAVAPGYLHATFASAVFGFVDDFECRYDAATGVIAVRSGARTGYSDFGVNRGRVEEIRKIYLAAPPSSPPQ